MFFMFLGARELFDSPALENLAHALNIVQRRYPTLTIGQLSTLLRVGMAPQKQGQAVSISDIVALSPGQKYVTVARQIEQLGDGTKSQPGLQLIEKKADPADRRNRWVGISERGKRLLYELDLILAPEIVQSIGKNPTREQGVQR